jgi:hypothetical protein
MLAAGDRDPEAFVVLLCHTPNVWRGRGPSKDVRMPMIATGY